LEQNSLHWIQRGGAHQHVADVQRFGRNGSIFIRSLARGITSAAHPAKTRPLRCVPPFGMPSPAPA